MYVCQNVRTHRRERERERASSSDVSPNVLLQSLQNAGGPMARGTSHVPHARESEREREIERQEAAMFGGHRHASAKTWVGCPGQLLKVGGQQTGTTACGTTTSSHAKIQLGDQ